MDLEPEGIVPPDTDEVVGLDPLQREIEQLMEQGRLHEALAAIDKAMASGAGKGLDLTFLRGDASFALGKLRDAESCFRKVLASDPDCPASRSRLAESLFLQWRFEDAERAARAARELPDALVEADIILACVLERRGAFDEAEGLFERAASAAPDKYVLPTRMTVEEFEKEVKDAARSLPRQFRQCFDRVPVVVQQLPEKGLFACADEEMAPDMLGLFDGIPLPDTAEYAGEPRANTIYLFQRNLERMAVDRDELVEQIAITLQHELGHYLGFEEEDMDGLGLA